MFHHRLFQIQYSYHERQGKWHDCDDFEFTGWSKDRKQSLWHILAHSKEVAVAHFTDRSISNQPSGQDTKIDYVKEIKIDAVVIHLDLD